MTDHAIAGGRIALMGLLLAGALASTAGSARAQYYGFDDEGDPFPPYREYRQRDYGYRYAPPPPSVRVSPNDAGRHFAARNYGLARVDRSVDRGNLRIIDGVTADGRHLRLVLDAWSGDLLRRITLPGQPQLAPRVARIDPREEHPAPRSHLVPQPPERPAELKPPAEPTPPVEAAAPATTSPPPAVMSPEPSPGPADPQSGADKPKLVNPEDVRGIEEGERQPPIAAAQPAVPAPEAQPIAPPAPLEAAPAPVAPAPTSETQIAPVTPLE
ncbi:hypothetical protein [Bosea thiooxidans]